MTIAALWGPGSGAPITIVLGIVAGGLGIASAYVARYRPDLLDRAERWMRERLP